MKACAWRACKKLFRTKSGTRRFCTDHEERRPRLVHDDGARRSVMRAIALRYRNVGPTFRVHNLQHALPDLAAQAIAQILVHFSDQALLAVEGSPTRRRYRYIGPKAALDDALSRR